ncbi:hypothetical protein CPY51_01430 [Rhizobium tubonense]|uniref:Uncharacterized protein n=2 Tax=Rhizobium tubonense TaxID=484088 RepID=A0A2W4CW97_9HYPH|nr:hypothetical protein CPY51_01430 [Rhizobium tubonense]
MIVVAACAAALAHSAIVVTRVVGTYRPDANAGVSNAPSAEEASFVIDNTRVTLQRYASELAGYKRYLIVESGKGQKIRAELDKDPGGWGHFDICETMEGDIALLNTSPHASPGNKAYVVRLGQNPRVVQAKAPLVKCVRPIGVFGNGPDQDYAFQEISSE